MVIIDLTNGNKFWLSRCDSPRFGSLVVTVPVGENNLTFSNYQDPVSAANGFLASGNRLYARGINCPYVMY
jgi:hypothetical protein